MIGLPLYWSSWIVIAGRHQEPKVYSLSHVAWILPSLESRSGNARGSWESFSSGIARRMVSRNIWERPSEL
jgi:hypothetical protein